MQNLVIPWSRFQKAYFQAHKKMYIAKQNSTGVTNTALSSLVSDGKASEVWHSHGFVQAYCIKASHSKEGWKFVRFKISKL